MNQKLANSHMPWDCKTKTSLGYGSWLAKPTALAEFDTGNMGNAETFKEHWEPLRCIAPRLKSKTWAEAKPQITLLA